MKIFSLFTRFCILFLSLCVATSAAAEGKFVRHEGKASVSSDPGMATVYIVRPQRGATGKVALIWTFADEEFIGLTKGKSHFAALVKPGKRKIWSKIDKSIQAIELDLEAGQTYYIEQDVKLKIPLGPHAPSLSPRRRKGAGPLE